MHYNQILPNYASSLLGNSKNSKIHNLKNQLISIMELKEILKFADDTIYSKTGKHLNNLQSDILEETLRGHKYAKIAEKHDCTTDHVGKVASELWGYLSDKLGEKINKFNVRSRLETAVFSIISSDFSHSYNHLNYCGSVPNNPDITTQNKQNIETPCIDLDDAPSINLFYGRNQQINNLQKWICQQQAQLITIFGYSGIGKTSLALQLIETIKEKFDFVIWRNLKYFPNTEELQQELIDIFTTIENKEKCTKSQERVLVKYLKKYRCLIILDDLQSLFISGELSGKYQIESQGYQSFFKKIAQVNHQSCILLLSQQKPREIEQLESIDPAVLSLELTGLDLSATGIFKFQGLQEESQWSKLIELYQGHPQWLNLIATRIQKLANGKITDIITNNCILLTEDIKNCLTAIYQNLADIEKRILITLAKQNKLITLVELKTLINLKPDELVEGLHSLANRCLIETLKTPEITYKINPVLSKFILTYPDL